MELPAHTRKTSYPALLIIVAALAAFGWYIISGLQASAQAYADVQAELDKPIHSGRLVTVEFPDSDKPLHIASFERFRPGNIWSLVSRDHPLDGGYVPGDLTDLSVPHGDSDQPMQVQRVITDQLAKLMAAAETDGESLMISSAYRSIDEQHQLYDDFVERMGEEMAREYVALPRASEHHTGLAVDFSNASELCAQDSDNCALGVSTATWLRDNAYRFGFIQRYPEGKQPITGIGHEPWHYRYVGVVLAGHIEQSGLTLDEALTQMRPAYARTAASQD